MRGTIASTVGLAMAGLAVLTAPAAAQYPDRPVRIVVPYTPGGTVDVLARALAPRLQQATGQPFVIDNRPGAGGNIGAEAVAKANPDGYTLFMATNAPLTINVALYRNIRYDPLKDFAPVIVSSFSSLVLVVNPKLPATSVSELIALAKAKPGALSVGTSGVGTTAHLSLVQFNKLAGVNMVHVPHRSGPPSLTATIAGDVQLAFSDIVPAMPLVRDGRLRALGASGAKRAVIAPELPTIAESGLPGFEVSAWTGAWLPAGTPRPIVERLNQEFNRALKDPEFRQKLISLGIDAAGGTVTEAEDFLRREVPRWKQIVVDAGIEIN
ncbi:MAG: tripartite tricarboxylate transporter substrate binding protein [Hyphomicrobiales bacterium]|nr:tripartite tricarboxylate transporter substrate binding protein [Hyphomicrobiales bacterium]